MLDIIPTNPKLTTLFDTLPEAPSPDLSDRYAFIDTKKVVNDMMDLGYVVDSWRFPRYRTNAGAFGLHEVDFRKTEDAGRKKTETPRVLFLNSYDGSRRAQVITGIFRLVCLNGMIAGKADQNEKFLHLGDYEEELVSQIKSMGSRAATLMNDIEKYKSIELPKPQAIKMAQKALEIKDPKGDAKYAVEPRVALMPRRQPDTKADLWTQWNVLQENLLKGGIPSTSSDGKMRVTRAVTQIHKSNSLNQSLWDLLKETSDLVA